MVMLCMPLVGFALGAVFYSNSDSLHFVFQTLTTSEAADRLNRLVINRDHQLCCFYSRIQYT
jgi:hypothetical protein